MGLGCSVVGVFLNLVSGSSFRDTSAACGRTLRALWKRCLPCRHIVRLLKGLRGCGPLQQGEDGECSVAEQGTKPHKRKKERSFLRLRSNSALKKALRSRRRRTFDRIASWSRYVEESIRCEIAEVTSPTEAEHAVDWSQLFFGQKFASGAHSRLYHGIYNNQTVAIKLMMPPSDDLQLSCRLEREFFQEVTLLSRLRHRNIIEFVGACKKPPIYCVITEYLPGGSLKAFLHKSEPNSIPMSMVTRMALDVARGMEYLHLQGVIHRDLKSANLLMTDDFHVKIADFGVSCLEAQRKSMKGFMGTYRWMAPEMIKEEVPSRKADVYSFGIVLWELCTGLVPFGDMTPVQAAFAICQEKARPPIPLHCPKELAKLMQRCWSRKPANRPEFSQITKILHAFNVAQQSAIVTPNTPI